MIVHWPGDLKVLQDAPPHNHLAGDRQPGLRGVDLSRRHQPTVQEGASGLFLKAAKAGSEPAGAGRIVEGLDVPFRAEPMDALPIFITVIYAGLKLVALTKPAKPFLRERNRPLFAGAD